MILPVTGFSLILIYSYPSCLSTSLTVAQQRAFLLYESVCTECLRTSAVSIWIIVTNYMFKIISLIWSASWSSILSTPIFPSLLSQCSAVQTALLELSVPFQVILCVWQWQGCIVFEFHFLMWFLQLWVQTLPRWSLYVRIHQAFSLPSLMNRIWGLGDIVVSE